MVTVGIVGGTGYTGVELLRLLAAPQYDRAGVAAALARTRDNDAQVRARVETSIVEFASTLSAADREILARGLANRSNLATDRAAPAR